MPKNPADWLPTLFTKSEGTVREATTKKFSEFTKVEDGEGVQLVGLKGNSNIRVDVDDLTVEIPEVTTSTVMLETDDVLRNSRGQFMSTEGMADLKTQKDANRYLAEALSTIPEISEADIEQWNGYQATISSLEGRVSTNEVDIDTLENKVKALEGAVGEHSFVFEGISNNPREGQFILKGEGNLNTNTLSEESGIIYFSETDRNGNSVDWDRTAVGDVIRMSGIDGQTAELKVEAQAGPSSFIYKKMSGGLDRLSELPYDFILLSSFDPAGLATTQYVDAQDKDLSDRIDAQDDKFLNADLGSNNKPRGELYMGGRRVRELKDPVGGTDAAHKKYVDDKVKDALESGEWPTKDYVAPANLVLWKYTTKEKEALASNEFSIDFRTNSNISVHLSGWINGKFYFAGKTSNYTHEIGNQVATINEWNGSNVLGFKANKWWLQQKTGSSGNYKYHNSLDGGWLKMGLDTHPLVEGRYYQLNFPSLPLFYYNYDQFLNGTPPTSTFLVDENGYEMAPDDAVDMGEVWE